MGDFMTKNVFAGIILLAAFSWGCAKQPPSGQIAARVNGRNILRSEVDRYFAIRTQDTAQKPDGDAASLLKMEILRDLIEREIMAQRAQRLKLEAKDAEVDTQIQQLRGNATPEEFRKDMERRGFVNQDMRNEVRRSLSVQRLVQDQVTAKVQITDAEVARFYEENKEKFNIREVQYHLGQIVVTGNPSVAVTNSKNDKALNNDQAASKVRRLASELQAGADFQQLARDYSEDPQTARNGGDLGYQTVSSLERFGPSLAQTISKMKVGDVTPVIQTPDAYLILKLLGKQEPGQRNLQDPEVAEGIRGELQNRRQQLLTAAFSEQLANESRVENFLAQEILAGFQKSK
jgi:peptidyl-prolyl cis-trans isomerase SurA